ncbi:hypothetical protein F6X37_30685 [Paraburkholderia sp. 31.1]|uniref:BPSL0761 family protein n=1 Tax=Paraburkholderia sp. 31.1 TaxID=2615205 RepID=UPI0016563B40|nr:BPSL0761 family protein [Paraburkholderia sp. 31.1]MBC8725759.1 hypothetical protein [Paraburkholderia sp. 31.1]
MTTPSERTKAVLDTRDFLEMLANAEAVTIPGLVQSVATCLLQHFPLLIDLDISASTLPTVWAPPLSPGREKGRVAHVYNLPLRRTLTDKK